MVGRSLDVNSRKLGIFLLASIKLVLVIVLQKSLKGFGESKKKLVSFPDGYLVCK